MNEGAKRPPTFTELTFPSLSCIHNTAWSMMGSLYANALPSRHQLGGGDGILRVRLYNPTISEITRGQYVAVAGKKWCINFVNGIKINSNEFFALMC